MQRTRLAVATTVLAALALGGCGEDDDPGGQPTPAAAATATATTTPSPSGTPTAAAARFLTAAQWPEGSRYEAWRQSEVTDGVVDPDQDCVASVLPGPTTRHRTFTSELDASGIQYVTTAPDVAAAQVLTTTVLGRIGECAASWAKERTNGEAPVVEFPGQDVADGLAVTGVFISGDGSGSDAHLFAVGRDGSTVTVVHLGQLGTQADAPVDEFTALGRTALDQLTG